MTKSIIATLALVLASGCASSGTPTNTAFGNDARQSDGFVEGYGYDYLASQPNINIREQSPSQPTVSDGPGATARNVSNPATTADDNVMQPACQTLVSEMRDGNDAMFYYNGTNLMTRDRRILREFAQCLQVEDALKNKHLRLIGHADMRGTKPENKELGKERAETVKNYLVAQGVAESRITVTSLGEMLADGDTGMEHMRDRRVNITLVDRF